MSSSNKHEIPGIGGYFELEMSNTVSSFLNNFQKFQSARSAFYALLQAGKPERVWVPKYICDAMIFPLKNLKVKHQFYDVNEQLEIDKAVKLEPGDWILYVNYFGLCDRQTNELFHRFDPCQIVLDYSQAFFSLLHSKALATILSPRKFFGVPDGGLIYSQVDIPATQDLDVASITRMEHLILRLAISPEAGYTAYQKSEISLAESVEPKRMSYLSEKILCSIDFDYAREKRNNNFKILHSLIKNKDNLLNGIDHNTAPLCYPYFFSDETLREKLIQNKIYTPIYWREAANRLDKISIDRYIKNMLPIPIDQRYGTREMEYIAAIINNI